MLLVRYNNGSSKHYANTLSHDFTSDLLCCRSAKQYSLECIPAQDLCASTRYLCTSQKPTDSWRLSYISRLPIKARGAFFLLLYPKEAVQRWWVADRCRRNEMRRRELWKSARLDVCLEAADERRVVRCQERPRRCEVGDKEEGEEEELTLGLRV